jgi:hypothetical protein
LAADPLAAAELYKQGLVTKVLVSRVKEDRATDIGAVLGHTESNRQVLLKLGVPASVTEVVRNANKAQGRRRLPSKSGPSAMVP